MPGNDGIDWTRDQLLSLSYDMTPRHRPMNDGIEGTFTQADYYAYDSLGATWQFVGPDSPLPPLDRAVRAGRDADGSPIFVGRAFHEGDMLPAKVIPNLGCAFVSHSGQEVTLVEYEILRTGEFVWEFALNGEIPQGAVEAGRTVDGEKLYFGRAIHQGTQTPGKVQASHGCLYIPFNGEEVALNEYEVLVVK